MKTTFTFFFSLLLLVTAANAQKTYTISKNETWSDKTNYPNPCFNCTFDLASNVVFTIDRDVTFSDVTINGGTVVIEKRNLMLWTSGGKNRFNGTNLIFKGNGQFTGNGPIVLNNSTFSFFEKSNLLSNHSLEMFSSTINFNANSSFTGQGSIVSLTNSRMIAGDGITSSNAFIKMNGAKLILEDKNSGIEALNINNYYYNWSDYTSTVLGQSIKTTNSNKNCGGSAPNSCSAPIVYGPIALTYTGLGSAIILPVIISDFTLNNTSNAINLVWSTRQESNSAFFAIERSIDGSSWKQVGQVKATGNSANVVKYNFTDVTKVNGVAHYRLKMVDLDNRFVYSDVRSTRSSAIATVKVFPNPASDYATITLDAKAGNTKIRLINQNGQVVTEQNIAAGNLVANMQLKQVQNGTYAINIADANGTSQTIKLIVQHN
ncbi:MAG: T9SS type A sorting domain-containing protein [Chitinophagaceae bacterium]|nr:MAG: T9SS type A sorting domain-containing protein [Chitinophagaceae bacterium]